MVGAPVRWREEVEEDFRLEVATIQALPEDMEHLEAVAIAADTEEEEQEATRRTERWSVRSLGGREYCLSLYQDSDQPRSVILKRRDDLLRSIDTEPTICNKNAHYSPATALELGLSIRVSGKNSP